MSENTLFLRFEGPLQAWGNQESKFVVRRTAEAPTKSGVVGLLCAALGVTRAEAASAWLPRLNTLCMGVRCDVPGVRWWDYHTVGADMEMRIAKGEGETKLGPIITRREYLCDASFLVALQGAPGLIAELDAALLHPVWNLYLGRKSCPPSRPIREHAPGCFKDLLSAFTAMPWQRRCKSDKAPEGIDCLLDWMPTADEPEAPASAEVWYDVPLTFDPPSHGARFVLKKFLSVGADGQITVAEVPAQKNTPPPPRPRADYTNAQYKKKRLERLEQDNQLCVFCKSPATTVQHITYRHAGGDERNDELRALCRLCHDAITMLEYGAGMGLDRINPEDFLWRDRIIQKRSEIIEFRSLETRRRKLAAEEVE